MGGKQEHSGARIDLGTSKKRREKKKRWKGRSRAKQREGDREKAIDSKLKSSQTSQSL
jgi:hypothetical protein